MKFHFVSMSDEAASEWVVRIPVCEGWRRLQIKGNLLKPLSIYCQYETDAQMFLC